MVTYMSVVYAFLCDTFVLHETLSVIELCCALWIIFVALGIACYKLDKQRAAKRLLEE